MQYKVKHMIHNNKQVCLNFEENSECTFCY